MSERKSAAEMIWQIEDHCGERIKPNRLRSQVIFTLQREIDNYHGLVSGIDGLVNGKRLYDPDYEKPIALSRRERGDRISGGDDE